MTTFFLTLLFLLIVVAAMAVGVIFAKKPIKGSCGGIQALGLGEECEICGGDTTKCDEENKKNPDLSVERNTKKPDFYNAAD